MTERLSGDERRLLAYLMGRGGEASAAAVTRRFGSDEGDGWFWNEEPPTSALGRVRLHGLAFVGAAAEGRRTRTVLVPLELREGVRDALAAVGERTEEGEAPDDASTAEAAPERQGPSSGKSTGIGRSKEAVPGATEAGQVRYWRLNRRHQGARGSQ